MPESKVRKDASTKRGGASAAPRTTAAAASSEARQVRGTQDLRDGELAGDELEAQPTGRERSAIPRDRSWVPWVFIPVGLVGVAWLVVYYIAGTMVPGMRELANWNILIGMGLMAASFGIATLWK